jgi:hypothetical protein
MSRASSDILDELHQPHFQLDPKTEAKITMLAMVAENIWQPPSVRIEARRKLAKLYQEIAAHRTDRVIK